MDYIKLEKIKQDLYREKSMFHENLSTATAIQEFSLKLFNLPNISHRIHCLFIAEEF